MENFPIKLDVLFDQVLFPISVILGLVCLVRLSLLGFLYENEMIKEVPNFKTNLKLRYSYGHLWLTFPIFIITKAKSDSAKAVIKKFNRTTLFFWILVLASIAIKNMQL